MDDHKNSEMSIGGERPDYTEKDTGRGIDCGVEEEYFPYMEKCCSRANNTIGTAYKKICPYCSIWTSLPDSASLTVTTILECQNLGYGKRIKI